MTTTGAALTSTGIVPVIPHSVTAMMEQLQEGYVSSVAATAGCSVEFHRHDLYGTDALIIRQADRGLEEVSVKAQLKCTTAVKPDPTKPSFSYQFKHADHLRRLAMPRRRDPKAILLVMYCPPLQADWTEGKHHALTVRYCCYWVSLEGKPYNTKASQPSVHVPTANIFDSKALTEIMDKLDRGEALS